MAHKSTIDFAKALFWCPIRFIWVTIDGQFRFQALDDRNLHSVSSSDFTKFEICFCSVVRKAEKTGNNRAQRAIILPRKTGMAILAPLNVFKNLNNQLRKTTRSADVQGYCGYIKV